MKLLFRRWSLTSREYQRHDNGLQLLEAMQDNTSLKDRLDYYESVVDEKCSMRMEYPTYVDYDDYAYYIEPEDDLSRAEMRLLNKKQYVDLVIDSISSSTVRDLDSLRDYLSRETSLSPLFGIIKNQSDIMTQGFIDELYDIIKEHKDRFADKNDRVGEEVDIYRNQADREGVIVSYVDEDILVEYQMPKGTTALNIIKPDGSYKSYPYRKLSSSKKWRKNLADNLLINNPQIGEKFTK